MHVIELLSASHMSGESAGNNRVNEKDNFRGSCCSSQCDLSAILACVHSQVETALEKLASVGDVIVTAATPSTTLPADSMSSGWQITFTPLGTPPHFGPQPLITADDALLTGTAVAIDVQPIQSGCCGVQVSLNDGLDWSPASYDAVYHYQEIPAVTVVTPSNGPAAGGTVLTLTGGAFSMGQVYSCVFVATGLESVAELIDPVSLSCISPAVSGATSSAVAIRYACSRIELSC